MCGINGILAYGESAPPIDEAELLRTREHMLGRGPDGAGLWLAPDRRAGLAHRRLSIIDLSQAGAQPMTSADGRYRIVYNGEIYNYRELRAGLEAQGRQFRSASDTEVLLHLYRERGAGMLDCLRGMYAFGIWDEQERLLFLARDPLGIKPLYVADDGKTLRFASQVKALLAGGAVSEAIEPAGYAGFFLWGAVPEPYTLYRGIRALPAGHWLSAGRRGVSGPRPFFSLRRSLAEAERADAGAPHAVERVRAAVADSVAQHLVADVPVGIFLSAGLDSAMLLGAAAGHAPLRTITLGFDEYRGTASDETVLAAATARALGAQHETRWIGLDRFRAQLPALLDAMDQPSTDGLNTYLVAAAARDAGMKVALSGIGGDELFGSYPSFRQVPRMARLLRVARSVPGLARAMRRGSDPLLRLFTSPKYAGLAEYGGTLAGAYLLRRALFMPWELAQVLERDVAEAGLAELATLERLETEVAGISSARLAVGCLEMSWYMRNQLLRDADWAGMAHSLEIRVPFVDSALLARLAPEIAHAAPDKRAIARALCPSLAPAALARPKTGFTVPVRAWLARLGAAEGALRGLRGWAQCVFGSVRRERRVLLLATDLYGRIGGIAQFNRDLVHALRSSPRTGELEALVRNPGTIAGFGRRLAATLLGKRRRFDLIVCGHVNLLPFAWLAKVLRGGKVLLVLHGIEAWNPRRRWAARIFVHAADAIASVSRHTLARFDAWASKCSAPRFVLPNCVDLERFTPGPPSPAIVERHALDGARTLLTMGRFDAAERYKGVDEVLSVLPEVIREVPDLVYLVAGGGSDLPRLRAKACALGLEQRTRFAGLVPEEEKLSYFRSVDAFAMPGRGEGFGIVYLEAAACGLPVVGSALDASREALLDGQLGRVVDPDDPGALKDALVQALRAGRAVPQGIDYYSHRSFARRCAGLLDSVFRLQPTAP